MEIMMSVLQKGYVSCSNCIFLNCFPYMRSLHPDLGKYFGSRIEAPMAN